MLIQPVRSNQIYFGVKLPHQKMESIPFDKVDFSAKPTDILNKKLLKTYGIKSSIDDINLLNKVYECVKDYCNLNNNNDLFRGVVMKNTLEDAMYMHDWDDENQTFIINFSSMKELWARIEEDSKLEYDDGYSLTSNYKYTFYCALAGYLNFINNPYAYNVCQVNGFSGKAKRNALRITGSDVVSDFLNAYQAHRMLGVVLPETLEVLYEEKSGNVDLKFPKAKEKYIKGSNRTFKTIDEVKEYLKTLGITARFTHINQANLFVQALDDVLRVVDDKNIFNGLKVDIDEDYSDLRIVASLDTTDIDNPVMLINPSYCWNIALKSGKRQFDICQHSANRAKDTFIHELFHYLDFIGNPQKFNSYARLFEQKQMEFDEESLRIACKVSTYAAYSPAEFCAEYACGRLAGFKYPKCCDVSFEKFWNGPKINFPEPTMNLG